MPESLDRLVCLTTAQLWQIAEALDDITFLIDDPTLLPAELRIDLVCLEMSTFDLLEDRGEIPDLLGLDDGDPLDPLWENWKK